MAASFAPVSAMSVVTGSGKLAPVSAIPVVVISDGSVPVSPGTARPVIDVTADGTFPRVKVQPIPIVYATGSPPVVKVDPIPIFVVGTTAAATTTWNSADKSAGVALSNGSLTATASGSNQGVRAVASASAGKLYFESSHTSLQGYVGLGLASMPFNATTNAVGVAPSSGWIQVNGSSVLNIGGLPSPVGIAVDLGAKRIWFRSSPSGNWNGNATYNPATNVGGVDISALSGALFPMATMLLAGNDPTANFGATAYSGAAPSGFGNWT